MNRTTPNWKIGTEPKHKLESDLKIPGPGAYSPTKHNQETSPNFGMGSGKRPKLAQVNFNPGPGN